jgi:hypothetical protein
VVFSGYSGFLHQLNDCHDITEILLKVTLNSIILTTSIIFLMALVLVEKISISVRITEYQLHDKQGFTFTLGYKIGLCYKTVI